MKAFHSLTFLTIVILSLLLPSLLISNPFSNTFFIVYSGYWLQLDTKLNNHWVPGPSFGAGIGYQVNERIALVGSASYTRFRYIGGSGLIPGQFTRILEIDETKSSISTMFELKYTPDPFNGILHPYIKSGIGFCFEGVSPMNVTFGRMGRSETYTKTYDSLGVISEGLFLSYTIGTDLSFSKSFTPFLEGRFVFDKSDLEVSYLPIIAGIRF